MADICEARWLGLIDYSEAWRMQEEMAREIASGNRAPTLLLLEHSHTYTFGRRGHAENLLWNQEELERRGVAVHWVDRGGDVTYHGPGQLVGYPLLPLAPGGLRAGEGERIPQADYIGYVRRLEEMLILAVASFGIATGQRQGLTGVWVQPDVLSRCAACPPDLRKTPAKIAAIGVKVDARGVSRHGFALNVDPDMSYWQGIVGCGLKDEAVTSLGELMDPPPTIEAVRAAVVSSFGQVFKYEVRLTA